MDSEILSVAEAAKLLKVPPKLVVNLLQTNELPGRNIGGEWRTTKRALVSFVDGVPLQMVCCGPDACCTTGVTPGRGCC
jgi:excisionase family DNA binding protein